MYVITLALDDAMADRALGGVRLDDIYWDISSIDLENLYWDISSIDLENQ